MIIIVDAGKAGPRDVIKRMLQKGPYCKNSAFLAKYGFNGI
jgi:hypothetical protein